MTNPQGVSTTTTPDAQDNVGIAHQKRTGLKAVIAVVAIIALIVLLLTTPTDSILAKGYAITAGALLVAKEMLSAFARDEGLKTHEKGLEDGAAICSLFAVVLAVPAVVAVIF